MAPKKGSTNNPNGSKPDKLITDAIRLALNHEAKGSDGKPTKKLFILAEKLVDKAADGDIRRSGKCSTAWRARLTNRLNTAAILRPLTSRECRPKQRRQNNGSSSTHRRSSSHLGTALIAAGGLDSVPCIRGVFRRRPWLAEDR